jgi:hypothetical protein
MWQVLRLSSRARTLTILIAVFLLPAVSSRAGSKYPPFMASLTPDRSEYWVGEPIRLGCAFVNWLSPVVEVVSVFGLQGPNSDLRIISEGKESAAYHAYFGQSVASDEVILLRYAKAHEFAMYVLYDDSSDDGLAISKPGTYQFHLRQNVWYTNRYLPTQGQVGYQFDVATAPVRVVAPPPEFAGALDLLLKRPDMLVDVNRHLASPANWQALEQIVAKYPKSRYAPHCLHALAAGKLHFRKVSPEYTQEAITLFERLEREYPDYVMRDDIRIFLADLYSERAELDKTMEMVKTLVAESSDNIYRYRKSPAMLPFRGVRDNPYGVLTESCWELFDTTRLNDPLVQLKAELD